MKGASKESGQDVTSNYQTLVPRVNILRKEEDIFEIAGGRDNKIVTCIPTRSDIFQVAPKNYDKLGDSIAGSQEMFNSIYPQFKSHLRR